MRIVLLNGPPRAGKDTVGEIIAPPLSALQMKFAQPIIDHMTAAFGVSCVDGADKDAPCEELNGMSRREYAIAWSEEWIKPRLGKDWFGKYAARKVAAFHKMACVVFTDSGFVDEAAVLGKWFGFDKLLQVRVHRPDHGFSNDSRTYWTHPQIQSIDFQNDGDHGELFTKVRQRLVEDINAWSLS